MTDMDGYQKLCAIFWIGLFCCIAFVAHTCSPMVHGATP